MLYRIAVLCCYIYMIVLTLFAGGIVYMIKEGDIIYLRNRRDIYNILKRTMSRMTQKRKR